MCILKRVKSKPEKGLGRVAQAEGFPIVRRKRCERASLVGRTVIAHDGRKSLNEESRERWGWRDK